MKRIVESLQWEIGASEIHDGTKSLLSHYKNLINLHLYLEATTKLEQPSTLSYRLSLPHPLQPCHIPNASRHYLTIQPVRVSAPLVVIATGFQSINTCSS